MAKEMLCAFGIDVDAVAGWLGSYGGEDSPDDISRGMLAGEVGTPRLLRLFNTVRVHWQLILKYVRARGQLSSGIVEGLNNRAKVTMRKAYGFKTFEATEIARYHALGKLPGPPAIHRNRSFQREAMIA